MTVLTATLKDFDNFYKGLQDDSIIQLINDMKLLELISKDERLAFFHKSFTELMYLTEISEAFIWENFKDCVKYSSEYDATENGLADLNKEIQNRFLLRCMQQQIEGLTERVRTLEMDARRL